MMKRFSKALWVIIPALIVCIFFIWAFYPAPGMASITLASPRPTVTAPTQTGAPVSAVVSVTPETVQAIIATLERPDSYTREYQVSLYWKGGSSLININAGVDAGSISINGDVHPIAG